MSSPSRTVILSVQAAPFCSLLRNTEGRKYVLRAGTIPDDRSSDGSAGAASALCNETAGKAAALMDETAQLTACEDHGLESEGPDQLLDALPYTAMQREHPRQHRQLFLVHLQTVRQSHRLVDHLAGVQIEPQVDVEDLECAR